MISSAQPRVLWSVEDIMKKSHHHSLDGRLVGIEFPACRLVCPYTMLILGFGTVEAASPFRALVPGVVLAIFHAFLQQLDIALFAEPAGRFITFMDRDDEDFYPLKKYRLQHTNDKRATSNNVHSQSLLSVDYYTNDLRSSLCISVRPATPPHRINLVEWMQLRDTLVWDH